MIRVPLLLSVVVLACAGCNGTSLSPVPAGTTATKSQKPVKTNMKGGASKADGMARGGLTVPKNSAGYEAGSKLGDR